RQLEGGCIRLEIGGDLISRRVAVLLGRKVHAWEAAVLRRGEQREGVPPGPPHVADLRGGIQDDESKAPLLQVIADGQASLAPADDHHVVGGGINLRRHGFTSWSSAVGAPADPDAGPRRATLKLNIIPLRMCSAIWQCAIQ